ncbi:MAG TPA: patatin-like phospholipase family protein, partial [Parvularculaceae bacterium]|nr:patatin-like phospholipase family protein [Parvularculaceae bacterium]
HETWLQEGLLREAIEAAYALPGVFAPRSLHGRWLIDGALVNPLPVSAARALGARLVIAVGLHADAFGRAAALRREKFEIAENETEEPDTDGRLGLAKRALFRRLFRSSGATPGMGSTMLASFNIIMDRVTRSRLAGDPPDVYIAPQVGHIPLLDFDRAEELIALGRAAVDAQADAIESALAHLG